MSAGGDAALAASLFAVDPAGLGGVCLRSAPSPARAQWLQLLRDLLPARLPLRRIPFNISDGRLLGGLDLVATLRAHRPVLERGVLSTSDGGVVVITMSERLSAHTAACLNAVLDSGEIDIQREGMQAAEPARVGLVALDEGLQEDEHIPVSLMDRMAFLIDLGGFDARTPLPQLYDAQAVNAARGMLTQVHMAPELMTALCATALALGAGSVRVSWLAVRAALAVAALDGRLEVSVEDAAAAGRLVFAPRATQRPAAQEQSANASAETPPAKQDAADPIPPPDPPEPHARQTDAPESAAPEPAADTLHPVAEPPQPDADPPHQAEETNVEEVVLAATQAAIPPGLLDRLRRIAAAGTASGAGGRAGGVLYGGVRGRPCGVRSGVPRGAARLNVMETLRAAAPWQRLRGRTGGGDAGGSDAHARRGPGSQGRVQIQAGDLRITRHQQRARTLTIFAVDASGSSALNRLAEAKGAVELLLADCYVRRDQVAVIAFRGRAADILLSPTRSLVRAKRGLAGLPGGGGTPMAAGIQSAMLVANQAQRRGETPTVVILSDGRANVARNGVGGREAAHADALRAAVQLRLARVAALFVDTSPRPNPLAADLAAAMDARYVPLPFANAEALSRIVSAARPAKR